jgi:hypothetical protein
VQAAGTSAYLPVLLAAAAAAVASAVFTRILVGVGHRAGALDSAGAAGHGESTKAAPPASARSVTLAVPPVRPATAPAHRGAPT